MMGGFVYLLSISAVMFLGAYVAGTLPMVFTIPEARLKLVTAFGAGLLVGTALAVIIPGGFTALEAVEGAGRLHWASGVALVTGFIAMLLLDNLQQGHGAGGHNVGLGHKRKSSAHIPANVDPLEQDFEVVDYRAAAAAGSSGPGLMADPAMRGLVGLVVHSAADGFAVGTATTSDDAMLGAVVGLAMVLHKAPVAFGLATFLMNAKWEWRKAQKGLVAFSLASPVVAILTYGVLRHIPMLSTPFAIALCVLFSGGTFLYAACMHILPEVKGGATAMTGAQTAWLVLGSILPLFMSSLHGHAHGHPHPHGHGHGHLHPHGHDHGGSQYGDDYR